MDFGPALNFGERGNIGEQTEKNEGEDSAKGMGFSVFGSRIGNIFEDLGEDFEGIDLRL
jgi:hypothetical protein